MSKQKGVELQVLLNTNGIYFPVAILQDNVSVKCGISKRFVT